jgi:plastocyanin
MTPRHTTSRPVLTVLALVLALVAAACGDGARVGSDDLLTFEQEQQANPFAPTTVAQQDAPAEEAPQQDAPEQEAPAEAPPPEPAPQQEEQQRATLDIRIAGDTERSQFQPSAARVFTGSVILWTNADSVARSVVSDEGWFDSGPIPPGGTWQWVARETGRFNYSDGTRPYAVGYVEVIDG